MGVVAEKRVYDVLNSDEDVKSIYEDRIFQGYVAPNSLSTMSSYIYISRVSDVSLDRNLDTPGDTLRRVRVQIDICDINYSDMVTRSFIVRRLLRRVFPSCIDGSTKGIVSFGQKTWIVTSIDLILFEED